jgi:hypothetical protein
MGTMLDGRMAKPRWRIAFAFGRRSKVAGWLVMSIVVVASGCSRTIEQEPPIPEHRIAPCETWCALMFDPVCPAQEVEVDSERECFEMCVAEADIWVPVDESHDDCAATYAPYVDCLASLSCGELQQHFDLATVVPAAERSSCGGLLQEQLECQAASD